MSRVTFYPEPGTHYEHGWPKRAIGDGFILLSLWDTNEHEDCAIYRDQFRDEYELFGVDNQEWTIEVRED